MVSKERPFFWSEGEEGEECSVEEYMRGGCEFRSHDKAEVEGDV